MDKNFQPITSSRTYSVRRLLYKLMRACFVDSYIVSGSMRARLYKFVGVNIVSPGTCFIGRGVFIDDMAPQNVFIGRNTIIASGVKILTHYVDLENIENPCLPHKFVNGVVSIDDNVFIGLDSCIVKSVNIGKNAVVAANSVVTTDVEADSVVGGVPAKVICKREYRK